MRLPRFSLALLGSFAVIVASAAALGLPSSSSANAYDYSAMVLADGASNYWKYDEASGRVIDYGTSTQYGDLFGGYTQNNAGPVPFAKAVALDGTTGYMSVTYHSSFNQVGPYSIEAWVRRTGLTGTDMTIAASQDPVEARGYNLYLGTSGRPNFCVGTAPAGTTAYFCVRAPGILAAGAWTHLVGELRYLGGSNYEADIYVNGILASSAPFTDNPTFNYRGPLRMGASGTTGAIKNFFNGDIAYVSYYPRSLATSEVQNHMNQMTALGAPYPLGPMSVTGNPALGPGTTVNVNTGPWAGGPPVTFTYQWQRCYSGDPTTCTNIGGANGSSYVISPADGSANLRVLVTGTDVNGSRTKPTAMSAPVPATAPVNITSPSIAGAPIDGQTLNGNRGTWGGSPTLSYSYQWQSSSDGGATWSAIAGATFGNYTLTPTEIGKLVRFRVNTTNIVGTTAANSAPVGPVTPVPPINTILPVISGTPATQGFALTTNSGTWSGSPTITYAYQWQASSDGGATWANIPAATGTSYTPTLADVGSNLRVAVTATNPGGSTVANSAQTAPVIALPPTNTSPPTITGTPQDGITLNGFDGTWTGSPPITFVEQWQTSSDGGATWANIAGATSINYTIQPTDVGNVLRLKVTATNGGGSTAAVSAQTGIVVSQPPANAGGAALPFITGTPQDTQTLTANNGTWTGTAPITYTYQWQMSSDGGATWANIAGGTASTYTLLPATIGNLIRVRVTGTNPGGNATVASPPVGPVTGVIPSNTTLPSFIGTAKDTQTLIGSQGSWTGSPTITYTYQWASSNDGGVTWANIAGATALNYTIPTAQIGNKLRLGVTATNMAGPTTAYSAPSATVTGNPPVNTALPVVSGVVVDGNTLSTTTGTWTGSAPITYAYQWQHSTDGGVTWSSLAGETASTYAIPSAEIGNKLRVQVTATNVAGSTVANSAATLPVGAIVPANAGGPDDPTITGVPQDQQILTANPGVWTGSPTITYAYQWQFSNNGGATWNNLAAATSSTYTLQPAQIGQLIRVKVVATNVGGSTTKFSPAVGPVTAILPANSVAPVISGAPQDGQTLSTNNGTWTGSPTITFTYQWEKSSDGGATWTNVVGATTSSLPLTPAHIGLLIRVKVTGTNAAGPVPAWSSPVGPIAAIPPSNTVIPSLSGLAQETQTLSTTSGTWTGSPVITFAYQWQTTSDNGVTWTNLAGATGTTYTVQVSDIGNKLRSCVTGTNAGGSTVGCSNMTATVLGNVPVNTVAPSLTGVTQDQQLLSVTNGTWTGTAPITYTYQWYSAPAAGGPWTVIGAATASTYTLQPTEIGKWIKVTVTATNVAGVTNKDSNVVGPVTAIPTANTVAPLVTGTAQDGQVLSSTQGTWTGSPAITYAYQWQRSNDGGTTWVNIAGATSSTLTLAPAQIGNLIRSRVTATNAAGPNTISSNVVGPVVGIPPANTVTPVASGTAKDGQVVSVTNGTWTGSPTITFTYQWQSSSDGGATWVNIAGATASSYTLTPAEIGLLIRAQVLGTNVAGSTTATSNTLGPVTAVPPANTSLPIISGTAIDGNTLTVSNGTWTGSPTLTYTYQWQTSTDAGVTWSNVAGATTNSLLLTPGDVGHNMRAQVTATNAFGPVTATSNQTTPVGAVPPTANTAPVVTGTVQDSQILSVSNGTWNGSPPMSFTYQWESAPAAGGPWTVIGGATASTYTLTPALIGKYIHAKVTATNSGGSATQTSNVVGPVTAIPVVNTLAPVASGTAQDFQTVSTTTGTWTGSPTITFAYQWQSSADGGVTWVNIAAATATSYNLTSAEVGKLVRARVTGTNAAGSTNAFTNNLGPITGVAPTNTGVPVVAGTMQESQTISTTNGTWTGSTPLSFTYQWQRSTDGGATFSNIAGATASTYLLVNADAYNYVRSCVSATNMAGSATQCSATTPQIVGLNPLNTTAPVVTGTAQDSQVLSTTNGTWSGSIPMTFAYQWESAPAAGGPWTPIAGATAATYTQVSADVGRYIHVVVTATNATGSTAATSNVVGPVAPLPPANTVLPVASGTPTDQQVLSVTNGTWTGSIPMAFTYQWQSAPAAGGPWTNIGGATAATYTLQPAQIGKYIRAQVTGTNGGGAATANSNVLGPVAAIPPVNTVAPAITGTPQETQLLSLSNGTWTGSPVITFTYQWQIANAAGGPWVNIAGATGNTYTPSNADITKFLRAQVAGTNAGGSASQNSNVVGPVTGVAPTNSAVPTVSGTVGDGQTISTTNGTWNGSATITYAYQWQFSTDGGATWSNIPAATSSTYTIPYGTYTGNRLRSSVIATNMAGSATAFSVMTVPVAVAPPSNTVAPVASGTAQDGQLLSVTNGTWIGTPAITYTYQWQFSTNGGATWANIAGATSATYTLPYGTYTGNLVRANVTATNAGGPTTQASNSLGPIVAAPPVSTSAITTGGTFKDGQTVTGTNGTWVGTPAIGYAFQWEFSTDGGATFSAVPAATATTWAIPYGTYTGNIIRFKVTASNAAGTTVAYSAQAGPVAGAAPINTAVPVISGLVADGQTLTTTNGTWTGTPAIAFTYQWQHSNDGGATWVNIAGANASTYSIPFGTYTGERLRVGVTGTNGYGTATAFSIMTNAVAGTPPTNTVAPVVSGTTQDGQTLSTTTGTWTGSPVITYAYQWQSSAAAGGPWANIAGATASTFLLPFGGYTGKYIQVIVTATNGAGSVPATSNVVGPVIAAPPVNTALPTETGTAKDGQTLTGAQGTWTGTPVISYAYQWQFSTDGGTTWSNIPAATALNYTIPYGGYTGDVLRLSVTATNAAGSTVANSAQSGVVAGATPVNTVLPVVSGTAQDGQTLTTTNGTWTGTPVIAFTYQWQNSSDGGATWSNIAGATASSFSIPFGGYTGQRLRVGVTGTNAYGAATAFSVMTAAVLGTPPVNTALPVASGIVQDGQTVSTTTGTWTGTPAITYTYQWQSAAAAGGPYANIAGATASTYAIPYGTYTGKYLQVVVTATNAAGSSAANSNVLGPVIAAPPTNTVAPVASGTAQDGQTLTTTNGTWVGTPAITFAYQWQFSTNGGATWSNIPAATASTYVIPYGTYTADLIRAQVTGTNSAGSTNAYSNTLGPIAGAPPVNSAIPTVTGTAQDGQTVGSTTGTWTGTPAITFTYQWQSAAALGGPYANIAGATASTFSIPFGTYTGKYLRIVVSGTNAYGASSANSTGVLVAGTPPVNTAVPVISGTTQDGQVLSTTSGTWTGTPAITFAYQWQFAAAAGGPWSNIAGATASTYTLPYGTYTAQYIRVVVTGTNGYGTSSANAVAVGPIAGAPPTNTVAPVASGTAQDGQSVSTTNGTWIGTPAITYTYQWQHAAAAGGPYSNIAGATASSFVIPYGTYTGEFLRAVVTGTNAYGASSANSNTLGAIAGAPPVNTVIPTVTGTIKDGQTAGSTNGTWVGTPAITYTYQWKSAAAVGGPYANIGGATASSFTIPYGTYTGQYLQLCVTGTNAYGASSACSTGAGPVAGAAPVNTVAPVASGTAKDGQSVSTTNGTWTGTPAITYTYQWQSSAAIGGPYANIAGATSSTFAIPFGGYTGQYLQVIVTGTNAYGNSSQASNILGPVAGAAPVNAGGAALPTITGTVKDAQTVGSTNGTWTGTPAITYTYQWQHSSDGGVTWNPIAGATASSYTIPVGTYTGELMRIAVTGTNAYGNSTAFSASQTVAGTPPVNSVIPTITGAAKVGSTLTASTGTWTGSSITYTYQWVSCNNAGAACGNIAGATASTYTLVAGDKAKTIKVVVTATNPWGAASATSNLTDQVVAGSIAFVIGGGTAVQTANGSTLTYTLPISIPAADTIVAYAAWDPNGASSPNTTFSDNSGLGFTWNQDAIAANGNTVKSTIWSVYLPVAMPAGTVITMTMSGSAKSRAFSLTEFAGIAPGAVVDASAINSGNNPSPSSGNTGTTTIPNELALGAIGDIGTNGDTFTPGAGWTADTRIGSAGVGILVDPEYQILAATGTVVANGTITSRPWASSAATLKGPVSKTW
jgi:hypothetical protein